jgi:hypothetical protein
MLPSIFGKRAQLVNDYQAIFETPVGNRVLEHLCKVGHIFEPTFVRGDPHESALREGERRLVLSILKVLRTDLGKLQKMAEDAENVEK